LNILWAEEHRCPPKPTRSAPPTPTARRFNPIAEANSLAAAQKHAKEALEIIFASPKGGDVSVVGRFGANTQQAFVAADTPRLNLTCLILRVY
jgi:hypothetical protein